MENYVSLILITSIITIIIGIVAFIYLVKNTLIGKRDIDILKENGESLFNYDMESKE